MMTPEETRVLGFVHEYRTASIAAVAASCLAGASVEWVQRVIANLEWFGYVTTFYGPSGEAIAVQITDHGKRHLGG